MYSKIVTILFFVSTTISSSLTASHYTRPTTAQEVRRQSNLTRIAQLREKDALDLKHQQTPVRKKYICSQKSPISVTHTAENECDLTTSQEESILKAIAEINAGTYQPLSPKPSIEPDLTKYPKSMQIKKEQQRKNDLYKKKYEKELNSLRNLINSPY